MLSPQFPQIHPRKKSDWSCLGPTLPPEHKEITVLRGQPSLTGVAWCMSLIKGHRQMLNSGGSEKAS